MYLKCHGVRQALRPRICQLWSHKSQWSSQNLSSKSRVKIRFLLVKTLTLLVKTLTLIADQHTVFMCMTPPCTKCMGTVFSTMKVLTIHNTDLLFWRHIQCAWWQIIAYRKVRNHEHTSINEVSISCYGFLSHKTLTYTRDISGLNVAANKMFTCVVHYTVN